MIKRINYSLDRRTVCFEVLKKMDVKYSDEKINELLDIAEENMMFAYYDGPQAVGFISLFSHNFYVLEISIAAVIKENQNKKIGTAILKEAYQYAKNNDYKILETKIPATADYIQARKFFEKKKFILLEEIAGKNIMVLPIFSEVL
ncbi:GNAT family N-acetyltransferase [Acholeplasma sp. OttesenSCG-928-E16]|nr:GNAT family N-acetyltransferase [Acholeplasma sp. OttesenSCG-928-E16]